MEEYQDDYIEDSIESEEIELDNEIEIDTNSRKDMLSNAHKVPFDARRVFLEWKIVMDEDGKKLDETKVVPICDLSTKQLKNILKWSGYDFETNTDLALHTIKEEYIYRLKHG